MMDFVMQRYSDVTYFMSLPWRAGLNLLSKAAENHRKETLFTVWANCYPNMSEENWISFETFVKQNEPQQKQSKEQIMSNVADIIGRMNNG